MILQNEVVAFKLLKDRLLAEFPDLAEDERTLLDTLEGETTLHEAILFVMRSADNDGILCLGISERIKELAARALRLGEREIKKRRTILAAMQEAGLKKIEAPDFTISVSSGKPKVIITDETKLPMQFLVPQQPKPDKKAIAEMLASKTEVPGATLSNAESFLTVRRS